MNKVRQLLVLSLTIFAIFIFIGSCVITLSDAQGALVFIFSIPVIVVLLFFAVLLSRKLNLNKKSVLRVDYFPKGFICFLILFFLFSFIPVLRKAPDAFMEYVGKTFTLITGKTPYSFFKDRSSFPSKLGAALKVQNKIDFSVLDVTFAWDKVCIFGPYTNNEKAKSVLNFAWNIEERSEIHFSDSINALVFLYQGSVNQVVDLKRSIVDFRNLDICLSREGTHFELEADPNGLKYLKLSK